jgi:ornithine decarboxylase
MVAASHNYAVSIIAKRQLTAEQLKGTEAIETFGSRDDLELTSSSTVATQQAEYLPPDGGASSDHDPCRVDADSEPQVALYLNDGCYGSFNCVVFDHAVVDPRPLPLQLEGERGSGPTPPTVRTKLFGPTCDSIDVVSPCTPLPDMRVGDWLYFPNMGAYTRAAYSNFNGFGDHHVQYMARFDSVLSSAIVDTENVPS